MHNSYYLIRKVTEELQKRILGWKIGACFSQNKDELIILLYHDQDEFIIRVDQRSIFSCLSFPEEFHRARKNSIDLFQQISGLSIAEIYQYPDERAFHFNLGSGFILLFKLFGNQSNLLLFKDGSILEVFKSSLKKDFNITLESFGRQISQDRETFIACEGDIRKMYPAFDKTINQRLHQAGYDELPPAKKWDMVQQILKELNSNQFYICRSQDTIKLSLFKCEDCITEYKNPILSLTRFHHEYIVHDALNRAKKTSLGQIEKSIRAGKSYIDNNQKKLSAIQSNTGYNQIADILMANLNNIQPGQKEVTLLNFYTNTEITIKLKENMSPQKVAENYYRKFKNQEREIKILNQNIESRKKKIEDLLVLKGAIETAEDLKSLKRLLKEEDKAKNTSLKSPFKEYELLDFKILVGRSAKNNDELTFKASSKDDLWLHARGVAGSHVVIRNKPGQSFPKPVIEKGAQLAAYYSKHKNESTSPVIYTLRKYVRKRKGLAPGEVLVEKEKVILVQPKNYEN